VYEIAMANDAPAVPNPSLKTRAQQMGTWGTSTTMELHSIGKMRICDSKYWMISWSMAYGKKGTHSNKKIVTFDISITNCEKMSTNLDLWLESEFFSCDIESYN
jgi:hypothetical protein